MCLHPLFHPPALQTTHPVGCECKPGECGINNSHCKCHNSSDIRFLPDGRVENVDAVVENTVQLRLVECRQGVCACDARCRQRYTTPGLARRVEMRYMPLTGYGLFAQELCRRGEYICVVLLVVILGASEHDRLTSMMKHKLTWFMVFGNMST